MQHDYNIANQSARQKVLYSVRYNDSYCLSIRVPLTKSCLFQCHLMIQVIAWSPVMDACFYYPAALTLNEECLLLTFWK